MAFNQHLLALRGWARGGPQKLFFIFLRFGRDAEAQSSRGAVNGARGTRSGGGGERGGVGVVGSGSGGPGRAVAGGAGAVAAGVRGGWSSHVLLE